MLRTLFVLMSILSVSTSFGNGHLVEFTFTKPHSLLNFVETLLERPGGSQTIKSIFRESKYNTAQARLQLDKLSKLKTDYSYRFDGYPTSRYMVRNTWDLMSIGAARSQTLYEFKLNTIGLLPNSEHHELFETLLYFETIYSDLIWNDNLSKLAAYCTQLNDFAQNRNIDALFQKLSGFYGSSWDLDVPFKVCLYPIPGKTGNSTATPKGNIVTCGILLDDFDYPNVLGVVFHELCHILYREQSPELQNELESWFISSTTQSKLLAYQLIDESMATALGNGWIYECITGKLDTSDWYNDYYINRYAKSTYLTIKDQVNTGKSIDKQLINNLVSIYDQAFPDAIFEFNNLFANIHVVADLTEEEVPFVFPAIFRNFRVGGAGLATPLDITNLNDLSTHLATRVIIVTRDNKRSWEFLRKNFEEARYLKSPDFTKNFYVVHRGIDGQSYVFLNLLEASGIETVFDLMKKQGRVNPKSPLVYF